MRRPEAMTAEAIKQFAKDFVSGRIFVIQMIKSPDDVGRVFMPIGLGSLAAYDVEAIGTIYEDFAKAGPSSVNGYPVFFSCNVMSKADWERCRLLVRVIDEAVDNAVEKPMKQYPPEVLALIDAAKNVIDFSAEVTLDDLARHLHGIVELRVALEPFLGTYVEVKK